MIPQIEPLDVHGHHYDPRVLAAPMEYVHLTRELERQGGRDRSGVLVLFLLDYEWILELRRDDVHAAASSIDDRTVCSCGLVMPVGRDVIDTTGHLDQIVFEPVSTYVVSESVPPGREPRYGVACSLCGWCAPADDLRAAHVARRHHRCVLGVDADPLALRRHLGL